jgi:hypothetical protein
MPDSNRNSESINDRAKEKSTSNSGYQKLPDNPNPSNDSISTAGDSANGKYSRTAKRKQDIDRATTRGGS